jgi:hypothetical protein
MEKADEPVSLIANFPDLDRPKFLSLKPLRTRAPPSIAPQS